MIKGDHISNEKLTSVGAKSQLDKTPNIPKKTNKSSRKKSVSSRTTKHTTQPTNDSELLPTSEMIKIYKNLLLLRRFEERTGQLYSMKKIQGFCHLYIGQEAIAAGLYSAKGRHDTVITSYRCHGMILAAGADPGIILAELMGKDTGISRGKGGSMHMFAKELNFFGGHGIVGAQVPIGTGIAFAKNYLGQKGISFTFFGDGAANQGQVYESFNMAKLWSLPVIYIIENNHYSMGTSLNRCSATKDLYKRAEGFDIPGFKVDGMNPIAVRNGILHAIKIQKKTNGPVVVECDTYRFRGHSMSDPAVYRTKEELQHFKDNYDPVKNFAELLIREKIISEEKMETIEDEILDTISAAIKFAEESPYPDNNELYNDI